MMIGRFQYTPPWRLTQWGFIRNPMGGFAGNGCDEYHNKSRFIIIPAIGMFVWFATNNRVEHMYSFTNGTPDQPPTPGCDICDDMLETINDDNW